LRIALLHLIRTTAHTLLLHLVWTAAHTLLHLVWVALLHLLLHQLLLKHLLLHHLLLELLLLLLRDDLALLSLSEIPVTRHIIRTRLIKHSYYVK